MAKPTLTRESWPPAEYALPPTVAQIEAGRPSKQRSLVDEAAADSRAGRLARLLAAVPGIVRADCMEANHAH